jgi:26S proteasome regulatory subunit N3
VLHHNLSLLDKYVSSHDSRYLSRVFRYTNYVRKHLSTTDLTSAVNSYVTDSNRKSCILNVFLISNSADVASNGNHAMSIDLPVEPGTDSSESKKPDSLTVPSSSESSSAMYKANPSSSLEVSLYFHILALSKLVSTHSWEKVKSACLEYMSLMDNSSKTKRTCSFFHTRAHYYYHVAVSKLGILPTVQYLSLFMNAYRSSCLHQDLYSQSVYINILLSCYLAISAIEEARKFIAKAEFPASISNAQYVRYLYYKAYILAVQLDYSDAFSNAIQSVRKTSSHSCTAGFRIRATKLAIITQLLTGVIPEKSMFESSPEITAALLPYIYISKAVKSGNVETFTSTLQKYRDVFVHDKLFNLVRRLESNVIKAGLKKLSIAYSRISIASIPKKLKMDISTTTALDAEFLCMKAIRDGVIDASIDHEKGILISHQSSSIYNTSEPQEAFSTRTSFCLDVYIEAMKAMRYPPPVSKDDLQSAEERKERQRETDAFIEEGGFDDDDDDGFD